MATTGRQRSGAAAEDHAAQYLEALGWQIVARNVRVGRDEIDLLAVDPRPRPTLVAVEVRSVRVAAFGAPEERVDAAKVGHMYRALTGLSRDPVHGASYRGHGRRVDLIVVDRRSGTAMLRHLRAVEPP